MTNHRTDATNTNPFRSTIIFAVAALLFIVSAAAIGTSLSSGTDTNRNATTTVDNDDDVAKVIVAHELTRQHMRRMHGR